MKLRCFPALIAVFLFLFFPKHGQSDVDLGVSIRDGEVRSFYLAVGDYYRVPDRTLVYVYETRLRDEELPVVFFLSQRARVSPQTIINLRLGGMSWMDITFHYGLTAGIFYVPLSYDPGPPYGKAYGYYKKRPKSQWNKIRLRDGDIVNLVNLKFVSSYYGYSPDRVVKMRGKQRNFIKLTNDIKKSKATNQSKPQKKGSKGKSKGSGQITFPQETFLV